MVSVLIVEKDPIIALDLSEAVRVIDDSAVIDVRETVRAGPSRPASRISHAFVRFASEVESELVPFVRALAATGANVVLLGIEAIPDALADLSGLRLMPFPFTSADVAAHFLSHG